MSEPAPEEAGLKKEMIKTFSTGAWRLTSLSVQALTIGILLLCLWQGRNMANNVVAQAPAMLSVQQLAAAAQLTADHALATATEITVKADQAEATQSRIFDALKAQNDGQSRIAVSIGALTQQITDVQKQVERIEGRQDNQK